MKITIPTVFILVVVFPTAKGFTFPQTQVRTATALKTGYVPDGFTPEEWEKEKEKERHKPKAHHFVSRSFQSFQEGLEKGTLRHLFPTMFAKERVKKHQIRPSEVPYMQREGSYDNTDVNVGYVPEGMTPHEWHEFQKKERKEKKSKEFGRVGPKSFKSRSLQSFQEDLEKGKVNHLMPVMFAKQKLKKGALKQEDVPYMQRGGSWDNSDVKGAEKLEWSDTDRKYESGEGPFSFLTGGSKPTATVEEEEKPKPKKFFGLFP